MKIYRCSQCGNMINMISESGVPIVCCGKKFTKKAELDKKDIDFGTISLCSKTKIEPNCIYAIIGDKTVKFDTKKDKHTELFQSTMSNKYQVWYKFPRNFNS